MLIGAKPQGTAKTITNLESIYRFSDIKFHCELRYILFTDRQLDIVPS